MPAKKIKDKEEKAELTIKFDCSYAIRRFGKEGKIEEFKKKFQKGEKFNINKNLNIPFNDNEISPEMAEMLISNKQGG
jgi:hypothetical protein